MAKKKAKRPGKRDEPRPCPPWMSTLTDDEIERLHRLVPIAKDKEACEMPPPRTQRIRVGKSRDSLWLVGRVDPATSGKRRKR
jgi:hypothetical protein